MPQSPVRPPTADDVIDGFNCIEMSGFYASDFTYRTREKLVVRMTDAYRVAQSATGGVTNFYELQFNRILGGRVQAEGPAPGGLKLWRAHRDSELLAETVQGHQHLTHDESFAHFELIFEQGQFDIVARDYFLTIVDKGTLTTGGGGGGYRVPAAPDKRRKGVQ